MKALAYLQKVGAVPDYDSWDLLMSLVVISSELYSPDLVLEPDCIEWVQQSDSDEEFKLKCECLLYGMSGDIRAFFPHICKQPPSFLKELIQVLLETRLALFAMEDCEDFDTANDEWFTKEYNERVGLRGKKRFPSKSAVLHTFYNGSLTDAGQEIMAEIAGTKVDFTKKVAQLHTTFSNFLLEQLSGVIEEVEFESEFGNPFEGGYEIKIMLRVPGVEETQECTLHWAPWPTANTKSIYSDVRRICNSFNEAQREIWLSSMEADLDGEG